MATRYYAANRHSSIVLGMANRSEWLLRYVTKFGDGAVGCYPIGDLYKTEVRALARWLDVPERIVDKTSITGFYAGQADADELSASYAVIDQILVRIVDQGQTLELAAEEKGIERSTARNVLEMFERAEHKRTMPPAPNVSNRPESERRNDGKRYDRYRSVFRQ